MNQPQHFQQLKDAAEEVRRLCIARARAAYFEAAASGLCGEGAMEAAVGAMQTLDLDGLLRDLTAERS